MHRSVVSVLITCVAVACGSKTGRWTGDRELETGNWEQAQGTGDRELGQATWDRELGTGNWDRTGTEKLGTGNWDRQLGTGNWGQGTGTSLQLLRDENHLSQCMCKFRLLDSSATLKRIIFEDHGGLLAPCILFELIAHK